MRLSTFLVALLSLSASPALAQEGAALRALNGETVGVQGSGAGPSTPLVIRCGNTITPGSEPLWVVDGSVVEPGDVGSLASVLDPADIVSIDVLKGAEAHARFGAAAQNGVVEITTRNAPPRPAPAAAFPNPATVGTEVSLNVEAPPPRRRSRTPRRSGPRSASTSRRRGPSASRCSTCSAGPPSRSTPRPTRSRSRRPASRRGAYVVRVSGAGGSARAGRRSAA